MVAAVVFQERNERGPNIIGEACGVVPDMFRSCISSTSIRCWSSFSIGETSRSCCGRDSIIRISIFEAGIGVSAVMSLRLQADLAMSTHSSLPM